MVDSLCKKLRLQYELELLVTKNTGFWLSLAGSLKRNPILWVFQSHWGVECLANYDSFRWARTTLKNPDFNWLILFFEALASIMQALS